MAAEAGKAEVSHGVHYTEHRGTIATLAFGQELFFTAGSEMRIVAGLESAFLLGAENKIGIATNTHIEFGAEVKYVRGIAVELAEEGGGNYKHAFSTTAGAVDPTAFKYLDIFIGISVVPQVLAIAGMLTAIKTVFVDGDTLIPGGETGAKGTIGGCQNIAGLVMFIGTLALNKIIKNMHLQPLSAMTVNHSPEAFIGVRGTLAKPGTAGVEFEPQKFKMSVSGANRTFRTSGHEVVGYETILSYDSSIEASDSEMTIKSPKVLLETSDKSGTSVSLKGESFDAKATDLTGQPRASLSLGTLDLVPNGGVAAKMDGIRLAVGKGSAVSMGSDWVRVSVNDGTQLEIDKGTHAKLSYANSSASVLLKQTEASLNFGNQSFKIGPTGVDIAGAITILAPAVGVPDPKAKVTVSAEILAVVAADMKGKVETVATQKATEAMTFMSQQMNNIKRTLETRISEASAKAGATA